MIVGGIQIHEIMGQQMMKSIQRSNNPTNVTTQTSIKPTRPTRAEEPLTLDQASKAAIQTESEMPYGPIILIGGPATIVGTAVLSNPYVAELVQDITGFGEPTDPMGNPIAY